MARQPMVVQFGMGTDLRGADYTKAAIRAVKGGLNIPDGANGGNKVVVNTGCAGQTAALRTRSDKGGNWVRA